MTSQIFKHRVLVIALFVMAAVGIQAQQPTMQSLIGQSVAKIQQPTPEAFINCIAELKQSLTFSVMNPHDSRTENMMAEVEQTISKMEKMKNADQSDLCTLRGFLYMVRIVQDPTQNGQRYYIDVMQNYEKALKLNPDNKLAKQLQQQFFEGMRQATGMEINE